MDQQHIRNFCIIAHIDHGKSTLADRLLELTALSTRTGSGRWSSSASVESPSGSHVTLATAPRTVRKSAQLIDTPGSRGLLVRGLALARGLRGRTWSTPPKGRGTTLANAYLAVRQGSSVPVLNKIDLPAAEPERSEQVRRSSGSTPESLAISAKSGDVAAVLAAWSASTAGR